MPGWNLPAGTWDNDPDAPWNARALHPVEEAEEAHRHYMEQFMEHAETEAEDDAKQKQWEELCMDRGWHPDDMAGCQAWQEIFGGRES